MLKREKTRDLEVLGRYVIMFVSNGYDGFLLTLLLLMKNIANIPALAGRFWHVLFGEVLMLVSC